ncbi:MAG: hypothetical protein AAB295_00085, partial [Chloroflexota bacterium]
VEVHARRRQRLRAVELDQLCREPGHRAQLAAAQAAVAADWGQLDARSNERLAKLCGELIGAAL